MRDWNPHILDDKAWGLLLYHKHHHQNETFAPRWSPHQSKLTSQVRLILKFSHRKERGRVF